MVYSDTNAIEVYIFNLQTGQLARIENIVDESFITVQYNARQQPVLFKHSNGDTMSIIYSDSGLLKFVDIRDQESAVKQTRWVIYIICYMFCQQLHTTVFIILFQSYAPSVPAFVSVSIQFICI